MVLSIEGWAVLLVTVSFDLAIVWCLIAELMDS